jgi:antitoxin (DNA-binding transcriptional repressor) of toxin-antitoxin stability system
MKTLTIRDFRTRPRQAQRTIAAAGEALLTSNGRPIAVLLGVDGDSLDETLETVRRVRALRALREIRLDARLRRRDRLTMREIDAIVARARRARRRLPQP